MSYPEALGNYPLKELKTVDIREDSRAETIADYLKLKLGEAPDVIITNPPFNIALDVIKKSIEDVKDDGYVVMLLRLNFLGSQSRKPFFEGNMPKYIFVHHERMSFYPDGLIDPKTGRKKKGTDSIEYCHMVWQKGFKTDNSELYVI